MAGLSSTGFERKRLPEIQDELRDSFRDAFGAINTGPESVFGQIIGISAEREDRLWQLAEAVYLSQYPASASGRALDGVASLSGISRLPATRTIAVAVVVGDPGTTISSGSQIRNAQTDDLFETTQVVIISAGAALVATVNVTAQDNAAYTVTINATDYTFTATTESADAIAAELALLVDADPSVDAEADGAELTVTASDRSTTFDVVLTGPLAFESIGSPVQVRALETGPRLALANTLTEIETPVSGWAAVDNFQDGTTGRNIESDPALRLRREQSLRVVGAGTVEAIIARIVQNVDGVTSASIIENRSDAPDVDGRPAHSFETVVSGGADQDVGDELWLVKPAGIETTGNIQVTVEDSQGANQSVEFSRPVNVSIWVRMTVTRNGVGTFPENGAGLIRDALVEFGEGLGVGDNVVFQALFGAIYSVPGIQTVDLEIAQTEAPEIEPDEGDWQQANIPIGAIEQSVWSADRIEVTVV